MCRKLFSTLTLLTCLVFHITAQISDNASDIIIKTNGTEINCRILNIDSIKINLVLEWNDIERNSYVYLEDIASYNYKGKQVVLQEIEIVVEEKKEEEKEEEEKDFLYIDPEKQEKRKRDREEAFEKLPEWRKPYYPLHTDGQPEYVLRLSIMAPGLLFEGKLTHNTTLVAHLWTGASFSFGTINGRPYSEIYFTPSFTLCPRLYKNLELRELMGKRVDYYSGTYIGIPNTVALVPGGLLYQVGAVWGFQRTLRKKAYWNINIGGGMVIYDGAMQLTLLGDLSIGFILSK